MHSNTGAQHTGQDSDVSFLRNVYVVGNKERCMAVFMGYTMLGATLTASKLKAVFC